MPACSSIYGSSIDPNDCWDALAHPYISALWSRMSRRHTIYPDGNSVLNLDWRPLLDSASPGAAALMNGTADSHYDTVFSDSDIAPESAILARYRLSRELAADDTYAIFRLPTVSTYRSCAIGIDIYESGLPASWKAYERKLDAFRALERTIHVCTDGRTSHGQGGFTRSMNNELLVMVTEPELLQDLPPYMGMNLWQVVRLRLHERQSLQGQAASPSVSDISFPHVSSSPEGAS